MQFDFEKVSKAAALGVLVTAGLSQNAKAALVINEIYTHGGSTSAPLRNDFIEIYNNGSSAVSLSGLFLQYASSNGNFVASSTSGQNFVFPASASIAASGYYLIRGADVGATSTATATGLLLSGTQIDATSAISMASTAGKIRLTNVLSTAAGTSAATVLDFIGYGFGTSGANEFEVARAAAASSSFSNSFSRTAVGVDTNNNLNDFGYGAYSPTSSAVPEPAALGVLAVGAGLMIKRRRK